MLFPTLLHRRQRQLRRAPRGPSRSRLLLEWLEPRNLLSILNVNTDTEGVVHAETSIAVNPTNPQNLIGSAGDYQAYYDAQGQLHVTQLSRAHVTFDSGHTWNDYPIPFNTGKYDFTGDPGVAFDSGGTAYISTQGGHSFPSGGGTPHDVLVAHSSDGGQSWTVPALVVSGSGTQTGAEVDNDKPYIAAWGHGNAIETWTEFTYDNNHKVVESPIFASVTHDSGKTWTAPVQISGNLTADQASVPLVATDGSIYVAFESVEQFGDNAHNQYTVVKVDPATGQPLQKPIKVADLVDAVEDYPINSDSRRTYQDSELRTWSVGNITADPTNALHLAVVWSDMRNSMLPAPTDPYQAKTNSDIVMSQSFDGGNTWSSPTALAIPNDQFMPWGAYNARGQLQIGYYDRSYDPANHKYGYSLASETTPGSLNFTFQQVTTALSDPTQGDAFFYTTVNPSFPSATTFIGDYASIAITPNGVAALWTDMRVPSTFPGFPGQGEDAFFALVDPPPPPAAAVLAPSATALVVPASAGLPPKGGTTNAAGAPVFGAGKFAPVNFLGTTLPSDRWFVVPASAGILPEGSTTNLASIWSLEPASADLHLADFSKAHSSLSLARAAMRTSGLPDDPRRDAFGIPDFAVEELQ